MPDIYTDDQVVRRSDGKLYTVLDVFDGVKHNRRGRWYFIEQDVPPGQDADIYYASRDEIFSEDELNVPIAELKKPTAVRRRGRRGRVRAPQGRRRLLESERDEWVHATGAVPDDRAFRWTQPSSQQCTVL